ncbi:hypothetical protein RJT34_33378 [Clitoria ternatea]|uniref:Uncharacterized protein n=1 Tax=Clitoria ternatea TaxID=43366 RepID=A0AAN9F1Y8_CLITE
MGTHSLYAADLSSYEAACVKDPNLQSFDVEGVTYVKTLQELKNFKDAGDPFTDEFYSLFQSVYAQQTLMLQKLQTKKRKLDKSMKSLKTWKRVSNAIFLATFVSVLIFLAALRNEDVIKFAIDEIKKKIETFSETMETLSAHTDKEDEVRKTKQ